MTSMNFRSPLATDLEGFLEFQREQQGRLYYRGGLILRNLDRFILEQPASLSERSFSARVTNHLLAFLGRRQNRKAVTVGQELSVLRGLWTYLRRCNPKKYSGEVPWPKLPTASNFSPHILTPSQIRLLLRAIDHLSLVPGERDLVRALFLLYYCTGMRFGEAVRLRIRDVDLNRKVLFITESKGRCRWVPFHPSLSQELRKYEMRRLRPSRGPGDFFFVLQEGRTLSVGWISEAIRKLLRQVHLKPAQGRTGPRPYDLRHTFAVHRLTRWYRQRIDLHARLAWLSTYMGHANLAGTETYLHATPELLQLAAHRFERRFRERRNQRAW